MEYGEAGTPHPVVRRRAVRKKAHRSIDEQVWQEVDQKRSEKQHEGYHEEGIESPSILPMLSITYTKVPIHYWLTPKALQPKMDGVRGLIRQEGDGISILSRTLHPYHHLNHLKEAARSILDAYPTLVLDGELFTQELHFQDIVERVKRRHKAHDDEKSVQFWIFDCFWTDREMPYQERRAFLESLTCHDPFHLVAETIVESESSMQAILSLYTDYEGVILRELHANYDHRRSPYLVKVKRMEEEDARILGVAARDCDIVFELHIESNTLVFDHRPEGTEAMKRQWLQNPSDVVGRTYSYYYNGRTKTGIPKAITGGRIRWDLDEP